MNSSIRMSVVSATLGALLAGAVFVSMAQTTVGTPTRIQYIPHPRDMVQIASGVPYTVPAGKIFALTALGRVGSSASNQAFLRVNGVVQAAGDRTANDSVGMEHVSPGFSAPAGSVLEVTWSNGVADPYLEQRAWGYLVNQ